MSTFLCVALITSFISWRCQNQLLNLRKGIRNLEVSVYRSSNETQSISVSDLRVGDIYRVTQGQIIPADSILIQVGHTSENIDKLKDCQNYLNKERTITIDEQYVTGD